MDYAEEVKDHCDDYDVIKFTIDGQERIDKRDDNKIKLKIDYDDIVAYRQDDDTDGLATAKIIIHLIVLSILFTAGIILFVLFLANCCCCKENDSAT